MENIYKKIFSAVKVKDKIIEVALGQFLKYGIRKMTVQKLIAPLGISTKTVYKYFTDKEDLLKYCLIKHYAEMSSGLDALQIEGKNPLVAMFEIWYNAIDLDFGVNHIFYHDLNYYYPRLQDAVLQKIFKRNINILERLIAQGIEQGYFRDDMVPAVIPEVIGVLYSSITRTGQFKKYKLTTVALMQNTIDAYIRGICTEKGLKELQKNYSRIIK